MTWPVGVLYITYDGLLEPLGQSQVLAYLEKLATDHRIHLISFEKPRDLGDGRNVEALRSRVEAAGIRWTALTYHKTPSVLATAWDIVAGGTVALSLAVRHKIKIIHVRSYVPALMALAARRLARAKLLFDIRGFWVDERVDGGIWPAGGSLYRVAKRIERLLFKSADHVVTLTQASAREIETFPYLSGRVPPISVIPTCADLSRFSIGVPNSSKAFVLGYLGSVGSWYLFDETLRCFKLLSQLLPNARMLVVNKAEHEQIREMIARAGIDQSLVEIQAANHAEVAPLIRRMSTGVALIKPVYSKLASAPTKLAEYLGCGVPCLANAGVGDMKEIIESAKVGVVLDDFSEASLRNGMNQLVQLVQDPETAARCRDAALRLFSLESGVAGYREIYESLET